MKKDMSRRRFLKNSLAAGAALSVPMAVGPLGASVARASGLVPQKVILISIDSLDPRYLDLDRNGRKGGFPGNWLMPNVRTFLDEGTWFADTKNYLPAATDMNHLNAVAGGWTGESGINMVSCQLGSWDGVEPVPAKPNMAWAIDGDGEPVDTLFKAWKRRWPTSGTFYASGKEWVANMFDGEANSGIDYLVTGPHFPAGCGIEPPKRGYKFYDPATDTNPILDDESRMQKILSQIAFESNPESFPPDFWTVDATLKVMRAKRPNFGVVLLAQMDDLQHGLGTAWDTDDFVNKWIPTKGIESVSESNEYVFREAVLDGVKDVDHWFGELVKGIREDPYYEDALLVLYSDHGHVTHRNFDDLVDIFMKSQFETNQDNYTDNTDFMLVLQRAGLLNESHLNLKGFFPILATSFGVIHYKADSLTARRAWGRKARIELEKHRILDDKTGQWVCPWHVVDYYDMKYGRPGICLEGELYHKIYAEQNGSHAILWPDLFIFMKDKWQLPSLSGMARNIGLDLPEFLQEWMEPVNMLMGGHGAHDTQDIVVGYNGPGVAKGKKVNDPYFRDNHRISDIALTLSNMLGLPLNSNKVGVSRAATLEPEPATIISNIISRVRIFRR